MGLPRRELIHVGASRYDSIRPDGGAKQPDDGFEPTKYRDAPDAFPTFVVEVANNQNAHKVLLSKNWWFDNTSPGHEQGSVDIVFVAKVFNDDVGAIMVELWFRGEKSPRTATIRLKDGGRPPARGVNEDPDLWTWLGVPLCIPFEDLLLRPKQGPEQDFEVTDSMLVEMATLAWGMRPTPEMQRQAQQRVEEGLRREQQLEQEEAKKRSDNDRDQRAE